MKISAEQKLSVMRSKGIALKEKTSKIEYKGERRK